MDALPLPVLSLWTADASASGGPAEGLPESMVRVPGLAPSPAQALARAADLHPGRDVLLMRADAELPTGFWRTLASAWRHAAWDVLSPLDGGVRLFPDDAGTAHRNALAWGLAEHASFAHAGWSDVCSLWRASAVARRDDADGLRRGLLPCLYVGPALAPRHDEPPPPLSHLQAGIHNRKSVV